MRGARIRYDAGPALLRDATNGSKRIGSANGEDARNEGGRAARVVFEHEFAAWSLSSYRHFPETRPAAALGRCDASMV